MISNEERQALRAEVDSGNYDISSAMDAVARATKGSAVRAALYKVIYWLKKNYSSSSEGLETRQPLLTAGDNVTITTDPSDSTKQILSAKDTKNTVGNEAQDLHTTNYFVLTASKGTGAGSNRTSYVNEGTFIDSDGNVFIDGEILEYAADYASATWTGTVPTSGYVYTGDIMLSEGSYVASLKLQTSSGTVATGGGVDIDIQTFTNGSWTDLSSSKVRHTIAANSITPCVSSAMIIAVPENTTKIRARLTRNFSATWSGATLTLEVL